MNRRSAATVVAFVLLITGGLAVAWLSVPYVRFAPGPTVDVLGDQSPGKPIISVKGHETYPTGGQLRMTTVSSTRREARLSLWEAMRAWISPDQALYPREAIFPDQGSGAEDEAESQVEMVSSQDSAIAAALTELGYTFPSKAAVLSVLKGSAADGKLQVHDIFVSVNGTPITSTDQVPEIVGALKPGSMVAIVVRRKGKERTVDLVTKPNPDKPGRSLIGISLGLGYDFPFQVSVDIPEQIGGPSAGLMFSLAIYDTLTPGELTGGKNIAGTGTIDEKGEVGPIGGIRQKIAGAEADGARVFLVPADNCSEAVGAKTDMILIEAKTMHSSLEAIKDYAAGDLAKLPHCPAVSAEAR